MSSECGIWSPHPEGCAAPNARAHRNPPHRGPILVRVGGTLPIYPALAAKGIPTIGTGFALRESNVHSPNERMRVEDFDRAVAAATELYKGLAALA